jgi:acyl-CoA synthetase (AMP-forming)/AMP-acid ligase II
MKEATLITLLQSRAQSHGERRAYTFLADGEREHASLSYGELERIARAIAVHLRERVRPGDRVVLAYPPGLEFIAAFFGCAYAGAIAVPVPLPHRKRGRDRLDAVIRSGEPRVLLSTAEGLAAIAAASAGRHPHVAMLDTNGVDDAAAGSWIAPHVRERDLALLQYTSGSTSAPRGVKVSHANVLANLAMIDEAEANDAESRGVSWLPAYHDMGLVEGILEPLYAGYPTWLMSPPAFLQRPSRWLQALSDVGGTVSGAPDFAYDLCVRRVSDEEIESIDLSAWRVAYNGAEPVRQDTMAAFAARFGSCGFAASAMRAVYGLAEATALVSASAAGRSEPRVMRLDAATLAAGRAQHAPECDTPPALLASCGRVAVGTRVTIADPLDGRALEDRAIGEICVAGPSVAQGYWGAPEDEARVFSRGTNGETRLRTGDLGFVHEGELYVTGRIKDLIILRGRKLYPQDIEHCVEAAHALVCPGGVAAFAVHEHDTDALVVVAEVQDAPVSTLPGIIDAIAAAVLRQHDCAIRSAVLVRRGALPRTSSGKLMRFRCREDYLAGALAALERSPGESALRVA